MRGPQRLWWTSWNFGLCAGTTILTCALLVGCGGDSESDADGTVRAEGSSDNASGGSANGNGGTSSSPNGLVTTDATGIQYVDNIPLNVWYDDPLSVAATEGAVPTDPVPGDGGPTTPGAPEDSPETPADASSGVDWASVISDQALESEVKGLRNYFTGKLQTPGAFFNSYLEFDAKVATLTSMAAIAERHPGNVSFKDKAKHIRRLSYKMLEEPLKRSRVSYKQVQEPFTKIVDMLNGGPAPETGAEDKVTFDNVVGMGDLMKRLDASTKWLTVNTRSESGFQDNLERCRQESEVLAAISQIIAHEDMRWDNEDFLNYATPMVKGFQKMAKASDEAAPDFPTYEANLSTAMKACSACHTDYRG